MSLTYEQALIKARSQSAEAGIHGSADGIRDMWPVDPKSRRRCPCCGARATHVGGANALALMAGCELRVRRWVRDGYPRGGAS